MLVELLPIFEDNYSFIYFININRVDDYLLMYVCMKIIISIDMICFIIWLFGIFIYVFVDAPNYYNHCQSYIYIFCNIVIIIEKKKKRIYNIYNIYIHLYLYSNIPNMRISK